MRFGEPPGCPGGDKPRRSLISSDRFLALLRDGAVAPSFVRPAMAYATQDVIVAVSSAPGPGGRAVVRLSGPDAAAVVARLFTPPPSPAPSERMLLEGTLALTGVAAPLPADFYLWPAPHTYTGQEVVELHLISSPPLVELLTAELLNCGARAARPGEFTLRAFLAGKLDLTRAEAVMAVVEADDPDELKQALTQLAGGVLRPLEGLREDLLNLLADVEAGLDFAEEGVSFVGQEALLLRLGKALAQVTLAGKQLAGRATAERPFRVVLVGPPNAGKSSLFNALTGGRTEGALVSPTPGTTRDYLVRRLDLDGCVADLVDTPGRQVGGDAIEQEAQSLGAEQAGRADLVLLCLPADEPAPAVDNFRFHSPSLAIATKCDLAAPPSGRLGVSVVTNAGLDDLRAQLAEGVRGRRRPALAPSLSRCRGHIDACLACLRRAHSAALFDEPPELLALELRGALEQLGEMVGAVYTDDLLDRVFSRFCIGK
jgi:tRNA modification GTPase